jgi:hypothetical protein
VTIPICGDFEYVVYWLSIFVFWRCKIGRFIGKSQCYDEKKIGKYLQNKNIL